MNQCECPLAGYCRRHDRVMTERQRSFCNGTSGLPREQEEKLMGRLAASSGAPPSLLTQAAGLVGAAVDHVVHGLPTVSEPERLARLAVCRDCPEFSNNTCKVCGCNMGVKASWKRQDCPLGKWDGLRPSQ
jgi:hypothetical protein